MPNERQDYLREVLQQMRQVILRVQRCRLDHTEFACLKALVLFKPGDRVTRFTHRVPTNCFIGRSERPARRTGGGDSSRPDADHAPRVLFAVTGQSERAPADRSAGVPPSRHDGRTLRQSPLVDTDAKGDRPLGRNRSVFPEADRRSLNSAPVGGFHVNRVLIVEQGSLARVHSMPVFCSQLVSLIGRN